MAEHKDSWRRKGVEILGLGMGEKPDDVRRFFKQTGDRANYPLYFSPWFAEKEKVEATPTLFILNSEGKRLFRADGSEGENPLKLVEAELERLLKAAS